MQYRVAYWTERANEIERAIITPYYPNFSYADADSRQFVGAVIIEGKRAAEAEAFSKARSVVSCGRMVRRPRSA